MPQKRKYQRKKGSRPPGRPRLFDESVRDTKPVNVNLTPTDRDRFEKLVGQLNLSHAEFGRRAILKAMAEVEAQLSKSA